MNFSEQPPSKQWAGLTYNGESFAEVWFKPEGEPFTLMFRIPQKSFHLPGMDQLLTTENLLYSVSITAEEVESWRYEGSSHSGMNVSSPAISQPLPPLQPTVTHLTVYVTLKPPTQPVAPKKSFRPEVSWEKQQHLEARWNTILGLEVTIDTLRQRMEGLRAEMESALNKSLAGDEKLHASNADVAQWNKAKSRGRYALPKMKEYIHRATWALGAPERKRLEELFKDHFRHHTPFPQIDKVQEEVENLFKDKQIMSAQGVTIYQECRSSTDDIQGTLRTLQSNAHKKKVASRAKGKSF